jgi:hypothetical protein
MLDRFLFIRSVPRTCLVSICKRYVRTAPPPTENSRATTDVTTATIKDDKTAVDSTGKIFTFKHGYVINL